MALQDIIIRIIVILGFGIWAYSKVTGKPIRDIFEDIKEIVGKLNG